MRYFITLAYNGAEYSGWQTQPNAPTIQETIEQAFSTVLRVPTSILGAGRTDAGVHARQMVAHIDLDMAVAEAQEVLRRVDRLLPPSIALYEIRPVRDEAHARFSATYRTYRYYLSQQKHPFLGTQLLRTYYPLDFELMNQAAALLPNFTDFTSFSKLHTDVKTNNCKVTEAYWYQEDKAVWVFKITADRFLRNMVRAIVGTLLQVGRGKLTIDDFVQIIESKDRCSAGSSAPGHALFLEEVGYPDDIYLD